MNPVTKQALHEGLDLKAEGIHPAPQVHGLQPVYQAQDGTLYAYDKAKDSIRAVGKCEHRLHITEFDALIAAIFYARAAKNKLGRAS